MKMKRRRRKPSKTMRPGEDLQRLVHAIESATADMENVEVTSPMRLRDKDSGRLREHDVVITFSQGHHKVLIALECRDRSRKVGVGEIEAFRTKCEATSVPMGMIVSSKGFAATAVTKAKRYNIGCLSLDKVEQFNWCLTPGVALHHPEPVAIKLNVDLEGTPLTDYVCYQLDGSPLTKEAVVKWANDFYNNSAAKDQPFENERTFTFNVIPPLVYAESKHGERRAAKQMLLCVTYQKKEDFFPFDFHRYFDVAEGKHITDAAVAEIKIGIIDAHVVLATDADGIIAVSFVPDSRAKRSPTRHRRAKS
jgi:restriction endonuclease